LDHSFLSLHCSLPLLPLHSFPTRRSSDLYRLIPEVAPYGAPYGTNYYDYSWIDASRFPTNSLNYTNTVNYSNIGGKATRINPAIDRKSTRLNSSHDQISYAVFCLKKKKTT